MMKSVVKSVVTLKSGLTIRYHCETLINWGKRVDFLPLYITNSRNCEYSHILTPIFLVTTKMTTVSDQNHSLGGHYHERDSLYQQPCTSARGVIVGKFYLTKDIPSVGGTILNLKGKDQAMKKIKLFLAGCLVDEVKFEGDERIFDRVPFIWYAENRKKPIADYQELVIGYEGLNEYEKEKAQYWCDELFTEEEISIIKPIIENFAYGFEVCEMVTPVKIPEDGRFPYRIYTGMSVDGSTHFGKLIKHGLPFDVVYFFDLRDAIERDGRNVDKIPQEAA